MKYINLYTIGLVDDKIIESNTYPLKCADSTGAGDVFNAGIIYGLKNNSKPERMLDFANAAASIFVSRFENKIPGLSETNELIKKININGVKC